MTPPGYWRVAETMAQKAGLEKAIASTKRLIKISPTRNKEFWIYVLASLQRMQEKADKPTD